ncbi:hypothetical protein B0A48_00727 [Cryoendolithus antarcticus]|uniref:2TM domain-containing protein n=1 Tax=Cryoendolithus antarcticus TaxID=1507870 RepID=A0A1V8TVN7_9PEZI|nr:hypothetical protein B0A48_00727 [Cryoendolithus antarcticus]
MADDTDSEKKQALSTHSPAELPVFDAIAQHNAAAVSLDQVVHPFDEQTNRTIKWWLKFASIYFVINVLVTIVLWLLPLYRDWIATKSFFGGWVSVAIIWHFFAMSAVIVYPIWDGRNAITKTIRGIAGDSGRSRK